MNDTLHFTIKREILMSCGKTTTLKYLRASGLVSRMQIRQLSICTYI